LKILFDQGTPAPLRYQLSQHLVSTTYELGWSTLTNGELLATAEKENFEVILTTDRNLQFQQDLSSRKIAIVVLSTTSWPRIKSVSEKVVASINSVTPSSFIEIEIP